MIHNDKGLTLLELIIGVLLASIVISAAMSLYITQHKHLVEQGKISDLQYNVRAGAEAMAKVIRMAGYNVPKSLNPVITYNTNPDSIVILFDSADLVNVKIELDMSYSTDQIRCDGHDLSRLAAGSWIYIYDPGPSIGEFCLVSDVNQSPATILHSSMPLSRAYPSGSEIYKLNRVKFYVDRTDSTLSNLMVQHYNAAPEIYAEDIAGLDFRYTLSDGSVVTQTVNPRMIRVVEINITAQTSSPDEELSNTYHTRNITVSVKPRNLGIG